MQSAGVLCTLVTLLCLGVVSSYPSIANFRGFLQSVFEEVGGNWSDVRTIPDAEEDLGKGYGGWVTLKTGQLEDLDKWSLQGNCTVTLSGNTAFVTSTVVFDDLRYTYDFVTDDTKFSNAVGEMYGKVIGLSAKLVVVANISNSYTVSARLHSFQLLSPTDVTVEQISKQNVTDEATFSPYIENSLVSFVMKRALPAVQHDVATLLTAEVADTRFNLSSETSSEEPTATPRTTSWLSTIKVTSTPSSVTGSSPASSGGSSAASASSAPSRGSTHSGAKSTTKSSPSSVTTSASSASSSGRASTSKGAATTGAKTSSKTSHTGARTRTNHTRTAGKAHVEWLTTNFNEYVVELLNSTGKKLAAQNMTPYGMPVGEEEMFKEERGSVLLKEGHVSGLHGFRYGERFTIQVDGHLAAVSADFDFANTTVGFTFSANDGTRSRQPSGFVRGKVTNLRGQLIFLANWTESSDITYTFQGLQLHPGADYEAEVVSNQTLSSNQVKEVSQAAGSDVDKVLLPRLQEELARHMRTAVEKANSGPSIGAATSTAPAPTPSLLMALLAALALPCLAAC